MQNWTVSPLLRSVNCNETNEDHDHSAELQVTHVIYTIVSPILLVLGTFGNFMVYKVIGHVCPGTTTSVHFRNLAVFDSLSAYIIVVLPFVYYSTGLHILSTSRVTCAGLTFLRYVAGDVAIWLVLVIAADRLFAVWQPLKVRSYCFPSIASRIVLALLCLAVFKNGHILFVRGVVPESANPCAPRNDNVTIYECTTLKHYPSMYFYEKKVRPVIALLTVSILPVFGVAICNAVITALICRNSKQWRLATSEEQGPKARHVANSEEQLADKPANKKTDAEKKRAKSEKNSLILSLTNSTAYFLFVIPSFILCLLRHELPLPFIVLDSTREDMLLAVTDALIVANHTLNFYICYAASKSFRQKVRQYELAVCKKLGLLKGTTTEDKK